MAKNLENYMLMNSDEAVSCRSNHDHSLQSAHMDILIHFYASGVAFAMHGAVIVIFTTQYYYKFAGVTNLIRAS